MNYTMLDVQSALDVDQYNKVRFYIPNAILMRDRITLEEAEDAEAEERYRSLYDENAPSYEQQKAEFMQMYQGDNMTEIQ